MNNLEIGDCQLETEDAPVTVTSGGSLQLNSVNFTNNTNVGGSAALRIDEGTQLNIDGSVFGHNSGNRSTIYISDGSSLTVSNSRLVNNRADLGGGALMIDSQQERTTVIIEEGSEFRGNEALTGEGGAIFAIGNVNLAITGDAIFRRNIAAYQGGALFFSGHSTLTIQDAFFVENESNFSGGGAIYAQNSMNEDLDIQIYNTIFSKNSATSQLGSGGAIRLQGPRITCNIERGVSFISNVAELDGAAIHISDGPEVNISESSFVGNEAREGGGSALFILSTAYSGSSVKLMTLRIMSSMFIHNRAVYGRRGGGTIGSTGMGAQIFIDGCKFHENRALFGSGGVFYLFEGPFTTVRNSSFVDNKAIWGGVIYGQVEASVNMSDCIFHRNEAEEGGAISTRGAINVNIVKSDLRNNSATEHGGAIRAENHAYSGGDRARLTITNSSFVNNNAGFEMRQGGIDNHVTRGGAIAAIGAGQYVDIKHTTFRNNSASEGGALSAIGPSQFLVTEQSVFENNVANFGSAIFIFVNNDIDIWGEFYRITDSVLENNTANSDGGAVRVGSSTMANSLFPYIADKRTVIIENCIIQNNRALNLGGGLMVTGVGLAIINVSFTENIAVLRAGFSMSGFGGGIAVTDGASVRITNSDITSNIAYLSGGGLFVMDSSVAISESNFTQNSLREEHGNGGAVALTLTANRLLPTLETYPLQRPILFECNDCRFIGNTAPLYGGAIFHRNSDPYANYTEDWNCDDTEISTFQDFQNAPEFNQTCAWIVRTRERLQNRFIRLAMVLFENNRAQSGAALFTNNPTMINITNGSAASVGDSFVKKAQNISTLEESGITIINNTNLTGGQGTNFASYPLSALLYSENADEGKEGSSTLTFSEFRSGDRLRFEIEFRDAFGQNATAALNFTGQTSGTVETDGRMKFSGTKLEGQALKTYILKLKFLLTEQELIMEEPLTIIVIMRECRIGEFTRIDSDVIECIECRAGTFGSNASRLKCTSCEDMDGGQCFGRAAVPEDHYWHRSSLSLKMTRCIGQEACRYDGRFRTLNETETEAHLRGNNISYRNGENIQCSKGYEGILCGSCESGYGREADRCRKCASRGVRYLVFILLILWAILFLGYFVRSVIRLSARIKFNKKFGTAVRQSSQNLVPPVEQLPSSSNAPENTEHDNQTNANGEISTAPEPSVERPRGQAILTREATNHDINVAIVNQMQLQRSRSGESRGLFSRNNPSTPRRQTQLATKLQQIQNNPTQQSMPLLTLANPVAEVLKILVNFLQVTSIAVSINMDWTDAVRRTLLVLGSAGNFAGGTGYLSIDCFLSSGRVPKALRRMIIAVLYPVGIFLLFALFWVFRALKRWYDSKHDQSNTTDPTLDSCKFLLQRLWLSLLSITYFFYIGLTRDLLRFFACVKIDEDTESLEDAELASPLEDSYWEEDTSVKCYSRRHALVVGILVIPYLCAVSLGYPLGTLYILYSNKNKLDNEDFVGTYGFLYRSYNQYYWELLVMSRKALIATVAVFAYDLGHNIQGLLCVLILVAALGLHLTFMPFTNEIPQLNTLESWSLSTSIAVFVAGLIFNDPKSKIATEISLSIVAIFLICVTLMLILLALLSASEELIDMMLLEKEIMNCGELCDSRLSLKVEKLVMHYVGRVLRVGNRLIAHFSAENEPVPSQNPSIEMGKV
eukprot:g3556.t1